MVPRTLYMASWRLYGTLDLGTWRRSSRVTFPRPRGLENSPTRSLMTIGHYYRTGPYIGSWTLYLTGPGSTLEVPWRPPVPRYRVPPWLL